MPDTLTSALENFTAIKGVTAAVLVGRDGYLIDAATNADIDTEGLAALGAMSMSNAESTWEDFELGPIKEFVMEAELGKVVITNLDDGLLVLVTDEQAAIGSIRYKTNKLIPDLAGAF